MKIILLIISIINLVSGRIQYSEMFPNYYYFYYSHLIAACGFVYKFVNTGVIYNNEIIQTYLRIISTCLVPAVCAVTNLSGSHKSRA